MPLSWVEIDLGALRHNFFEVRKRLSPATQIMGIVKSDAYGHGMVPVSRELAGCGAHFLGVSKFWEAQELRAHSIELPVLVLLGLESADMEEAIREGIRPAIFRMDHARLLSEVACRLNTTANVHVKMDTGMGRLGVPCDKVPSFLNELLSLPGIRLEGILSHFSVADEADKTYCGCQLDRLRTILKLLDDRGYPKPCVHISNSAGICDLPEAHLRMVRPGIMLYGSQPSRELHHPADLRPVMHFKSRVLQLKDVPPGSPIGYGRTFVTARPTRIATVPVGYDDGYPRLLSNKGRVLIAGTRAPVVGRVSMNMITVDVTAIPEVREGDEVVLLGNQGKECITADEIADLCGTISYEIYCNIGRHHYRYFLSGS